MSYEQYTVCKVLRAHIKLSSAASAQAVAFENESWVTLETAGTRRVPAGDEALKALDTVSARHKALHWIPS